MSAIAAYAKAIGAEETFVQADEEDGHALDFYRSTGARGKSSTLLLSVEIVAA